MRRGGESFLRTDALPALRPCAACAPAGGTASPQEAVLDSGRYSLAPCLPSRPPGNTEKALVTAGHQILIVCKYKYSRTFLALRTSKRPCPLLPLTPPPPGRTGLC